MPEMPKYFRAMKERYHLKSDYALADKLGIAQPEANLMRRGQKVPKPELCITIAELLDKNPVELLLIAQKDRAPAAAKKYWTLALTAVDVMLHVPQRPKYLPRKVEAIGRELREVESQVLHFRGIAANAEAVRLLDTAEHAVDAIMERWNLWKKGGPLYPNYLLSNQEAVRRHVTIRRLFVFSRSQMQQKPLVDDAIQVMDDQQRAGIKIYYAFREELERSHTFQRMAHDFTRHGSAKDINAASYDGEILMFAKSYGRVQLGMVGKSTPITMINQLQITWKPDTIRDLNPAPLFDMTRYVFEYKNPKPFRTRLARLRNLRNQTREMSVGTV